MAVDSNKKLGKFSLVGEDELGLIFNKIKDPEDRRSFSEVCKEWLRVEGLHRSSLRLLRPQFLRQVLPRFPNLIKFETSLCITDSDLEFLDQTCSTLEVINLNTRQYYAPNTDFVGSGLLAVAKTCPKLSKVSIQRRESITASIYHGFIGFASNLTHLDLSFCSGVSDEAVEAIASFRSIIELSLKGNLITDRAVGYLANGNSSKTVKTLILAWIENITDVGVSHLQKMHCLEHLSLASNCRREKLTDIGGVAISAITTLQKLSLEGMHKLSDSTIVALAQNCPNIKILDLNFCFGATGDGIRAFSGHQCLETISLPPNNVSGSDLDHLVLGCGH